LRGGEDTLPGGLGVRQKAIIWIGARNQTVITYMGVEEKCISSKHNIRAHLARAQDASARITDNAFSKDRVGGSICTDSTVLITNKVVRIGGGPKDRANRMHKKKDVRHLD
jgi:hypothetical protein